MENTLTFNLVKGSHSYPTIIIIADAWPREVFNDCLNSALLPEIKNELVDRGTLFSRVVSIFPSLSLSSHATLLTGVNQSIHGIPGHRWMVRDTKEIRNYIGPMFRMINRDLYSGAETIFEKYQNVHSFSIQGIVNRGAKKTVRLCTMNSQRILSKTADLACKFPNSLLVVWLPKGDRIAHVYGPGSKEMIQEMINISKGIGVLTGRLKRARLLDNSRIIFTADHGQKSVKYRYDLSVSLREMGYSVVVNPRALRQVDIGVFTNGDAAAFIYFNDIKFSKDQKYEILCRLSCQNAIGLIFYKYDEFRHFVFSKNGISCINTQDPCSVGYNVIKGDDPLEIIDSRVGKKININDLQATPLDGMYPDIIHQYLTSYVPNRSPDVLLTASGEYHFSKAPGINWRLGYHRGSHGGPSSDEMIFSAIATGSAENVVYNDLVRSKDLISKCLP